MEQDLCSADDLLRGEAPRVTQVAENGLHIKGKMNDGEPPPLTCIPFPAYNVDKGLTPLNNIFCSILHRDFLHRFWDRAENLPTHLICDSDFSKLSTVSGDLHSVVKDSFIFIP